MLFRNLFQSPKSGGSRRPTQQPKRRQPSSCRLSVEVLEDRAVPASLSVGDAVIFEPSPGTIQYAEVSVNLDAPGNKTVSVGYSTTNGTATAGSDYNAVSGKLTFAPGETRKSVLVPVRGDDHTEGKETFFVNLGGAQRAKIADGQGVVTIVDDVLRIGINSVSHLEGNFDTTLYTFTVSLSAPFDQAVTVNFATADGTGTGGALAGQDYWATSGTLTFAPGETAKTITVAVFADMTPEWDEQFFVNLSGASSNAVIAYAQGFGGIGDDDTGWPE